MRFTANVKTLDRDVVDRFRLKCPVRIVRVLSEFTISGTPAYIAAFQSANFYRFLGEKIILCHSKFLSRL